MRKLVLTLFACLFCWSVSFACDPPAFQSNPNSDKSSLSTFQARYGSFQAVPAPVIRQQGKQTELTAEARDFVRTGPVVFRDMDEAIRVAKSTGRQVVCWVSEDRNPLAVFNDPTVRKVSAALDSTTVQVAMGRNPTGDRIDRDGKRLGARVEFSSSLYQQTAETAYIPVGKLRESDDTRILKFVRGQTIAKARE